MSQWKAEGEPTPTSARSLPEGCLVSSAVDRIESCYMDSDSTRTKTLNKRYLATVDIGDVKPVDYEVHQAKVPVETMKLDPELHRWTARIHDRVAFDANESAKMEKMLRLSVHIAAYADWFSCAIFSAANKTLVELPHKVTLMDSLSKALDKAHQDMMAINLACMSNLILSRRVNVLSNLNITQPYRDRLLSAPLTGPKLFGTTLTSVQEDMSKDPNVMFSGLAKNLGRYRSRPTQPSSGKSKKKRSGGKGKAQSFGNGAKPFEHRKPSFPGKSSRGASSRGRGKRT